MRTWTHRAHAGTGVLLLGLALAGNATAAESSLSDRISKSFDESQSRGGTDRESLGDTRMVAPTPLGAGYPSTVTYSAPSTYEMEQGAGSQSFGESVQDTVDGFHELVIPAERLQAIPPADPGMDCRELYAETTRLLALGQRNRPSFNEDPKNIAIGAAGLVVPAASYLLIVTAYAAWYEDQHQKEARHRTGELREIMGQRRCFARD